MSELLWFVLGLVYGGVAVGCWCALAPAPRDGRDVLLAAVWPITLPLVGILSARQQKRKSDA